MAWLPAGQLSDSVGLCNQRGRIARPALGFDGLDYDGGEDRRIGMVRQQALNTRDAKAGNTIRPIVVDGIVGPANLATMRRQGFELWRDVA